MYQKLIVLFILIFSGWSFVIAKSSEELPLGQLLFIGLDGTEWNEDIESLLEQIQPGGIILFKRNILSAEQTLQFNQQIINSFLIKHRPAPLLAIDQEGGGVYRVPTEPLLPSAAAMGRTKNPKLIRSYGRVIGKILKDFKFSMNLAPVLDLRVKDSDFIGNRSFGANPVSVSANGILFAKGLLESGVLPTGKHFPGVGGLNLDPHRETPQADLDWERSWNQELYPFREFSHLFPAALLLSHVVYPKMDKKRIPASFSENIIDKGLREKLKFRGLVITDDLMMDGAKKQADPVKSAIESLKAGADMVMVTWSKSLQRNLVSAIKKAIQKGELDIGAVKAKLSRIENIKRLLYSSGFHDIKLDQAKIQGPLTFKSSELEALNNDLLLEILEDDNKNAVGFQKSLAETPLYVVDAPGRIQREILQSHPTKLTEFFNIKSPQNWLYLRKRIKDNPSAMLLYFVKTASGVDNLNWFTLEEKKRLIVVNLHSNQIKNPERYAVIYSPLWTFNNLFNGIEQVWNKKIIRKVSVNSPH